MAVYLAGTPISLSIPLQDRSGNIVPAISVSYSVMDGNGAVLLDTQPITSFTAGDTAVQVTTDAVLNAVNTIDPNTIDANHIDSLQPREIRTIRLTATVNGGVTAISYSYILEPADVLIAGLNSFQTLEQAELVSLDVPSLEGWKNAIDSEKIAALVEARQRIAMLRFNILNSNINWGQDNLNYVPEGAYPTPYAGMFMFNGNLSLLTPARFVALPSRFKAALCKAQVVEADGLLGGDPAADRRAEGLMLDSTGQTKQMWRSTKPIDLPCSKRAMRYLAQFVAMNKQVGRA